MRNPVRPLLVHTALFLLLTQLSFSAQSRMFGGTPSRNMVSDESELPETWDLDSGAHIRWRAELGSQCYTSPIVSDGKVFVGTNNDGLRDPQIAGDRGNLLVFRESDGTFLWQAAHDKLPSGRRNDWPYQGICSTPAVEGKRLYYLSNRCEIVCSDTDGFLDGKNDGPFVNEPSQGPSDEDVVWKLDLMHELGVYPHNMTASSPLIVGDLLYTVTGNGVADDHVTVPSPSAPSFVALNKTTGKLVWKDARPGGNILHGQWSNPAYGSVEGKPQVVFPGGDGWLYSFEPESGALLWRFDGNPKDAVWALGSGGTRNSILATPVVYQDHVYFGMGQDPEHGDGPGLFHALKPNQGGDVTKSAPVWRLEGERIGRTLSTAAISEGLVYIADLSGFLYCIDAETGEQYWTYDTLAAVWGSPFVADQKVYLGDEEGDVAVLKTGKEKVVLGEIPMESSIYSAPTASDGVLYIATRSELFAIASTK